MINNIRIYHRGINFDDLTFIKVIPSELKFVSDKDILRIYFLKEDVFDRNSELLHNKGVVVTLRTSFGIAHLLDTNLHVNDYDINTIQRNDTELSNISDEIWYCELPDNR